LFFTRSKDRANRLEEMDQRVRMLEAVNEIFATVSRMQDYQSVLHTIVEKTISFVGAEEGAIRLLKEGENTSTTTTIVREVADASAQRDYKIGNSVVGYLLKHRAPVLVKDLTTDDRFRTTSAEQAGLSSFIAVPLTYRDQIIGVLSVSHKTGSDPFTERDLQLLSAVGNQVAEIVENARLKALEAEQLRIKSELRGAREMQRSLLPEEPPRVEGIQIHAHLVPALEVSGDYYDFARLPDGKLGVAIGDIAGKGIPAALLMASLQANFRVQVMKKHSIPGMMQELNEALWASTQAQSYATFCYAEIDPVKLTMEYSNAGHWHPFVFRKGPDPIRLDQGGLSLGMLTGSEYDVATLQLQKNDVFVLYSDGVTEAESESEEQWEEENFIRTVASCLDRDARGICEEVLARIQEFTHGAPQSDDLTLVVLKFV
jgi:sigma-B regulation protein RsbU (phosphoserine phosphatase)